MIGRKYEMRTTDASEVQKSGGHVERKGEKRDELRKTDETKRNEDSSTCVTHTV